MIDEKIASDPKSDYYQAALEWNVELYDNAIKQRNLGWKVAIAFFVLALLMAVAMVLLMPLKEVVPYTIEVDRVTGETRTARALSDGALTQSEALTKYWVVKYVLARLTYDRQDLNKNYVTVQLLSDKNTFTDYDRWFDPKKAGSPYQLYGENTTVKIEVKSISFLSTGTASIRINKTIKTDKELTTPWVITLSYVYTLAPKTENDRYVNPLGFTITKWREDAEVASGDMK